MATTPNIVVRFYDSDMILSLYLDASFLSARQGGSTVGGFFFIGSTPRDNHDRSEIRSTISQYPRSKSYHVNSIGVT